jgi:hypothetical protein
MDITLEAEERQGGHKSSHIWDHALTTIGPIGQRTTQNLLCKYFDKTKNSMIYWLIFIESCFHCVCLQHDRHKYT